MQADPVDTEPRRVLLSLVELPIALGVAFATFVGLSVVGCNWAHCVDVSGLPIYLGSALAGIVVAVLYWRKAMRLRDRFRRRLVVDAVAILIGVSGFVLPQIGGWRAEWQARHAPARVAPRPGDVVPPAAPRPRIAR